MQCTSCHFENMPGVPQCGRCGAALTFGAATAGVMPPRARPWIKPWRRWFYSFYRLRNPFRKIEGKIWDQFDQLVENGTPWGAFFRMIVPGWPQFYLRRDLMGKIFMGGYFTTLFLGIVFAGSTFGSLLLGMAIALHASSIIDVVIHYAHTWSTRCFYSFAFLLMVFIVFYMPSQWLINQFVVPQQVLLDIPPLAAGDVFLQNPSAYRNAEPKIGDVVYYHLPATRFAVGNHAVMQFNGEEMIGRVVAGPGQNVTMADGKLMVDGKLSPWQLSNSTRWPIRGTVLVPKRTYMILSDVVFTVMDRYEAAPPPFQLTRLDSIIGKIFWRTQPWSRFGAIR